MLVAMDFVIHIGGEEVGEKADAHLEGDQLTTHGKVPDLRLSEKAAGRS